MYRVNGEELLVPVDPPLPPADPGAPMPVAILTEADCLLFYFGGDAVRREVSDENAVVVLRCIGTMLGMPDEKAIAGHPLASAGIEPFEFVEVTRRRGSRSLSA